MNGTAGSCCEVNLYHTVSAIRRGIEPPQSFDLACSSVDSASQQHRSAIVALDYFYFIICIEILGHGEIFVFCLFVVRSPPEYKI